MDLTQDSASQLINDLLRNEIESLESEFSAGRKEHALKSLDERGTAQELIREQYSGRYPFELLQNANDALQTRERGPGNRAVLFELTRDSLLVADKGEGFGTRQINALCGLGRSSKSVGKAIGYRGIGFKSVGEISERPQILSENLQFGFDPAVVKARIEEVTGPLPADQRLPFYAFPIPLDDRDFLADAEFVERAIEAGFRSVIRLPFDESITRQQVEADLLRTLTPRLLLFLHSTDELELLGTSEDFRVVKHSEVSESRAEVRLAIDDSVEQWLVFSDRMAIPSRNLVERLGGPWLEVEDIEVSVAVPLGPDGRPSTERRFPLSVYFPTEELTGLPIIVNAEFALDFDRKRVAQSPEGKPFNDWLTGQVSSFIAEVAAPALAQRFPGDSAVVAALSPGGRTSGFGEAFVGSYLDAMKASRFIPAIDGHLRLAGEALMLPALVPSGRQAHAYLNLDGLDRLVIPSIEDDTEASRFLSVDLEVRRMETEHVVNRMHPPPPRTVRVFYSYLLEWADHHRGSLSRLLSTTAFVLTSDGKYRSPSDRIYFPREKDSPALPGGIPVAIADVPDMDGIDDLLLEAGVRPFRWREILLDFILPQLTDHETGAAQRLEAHAILQSYFETETGDREIIARVGDVLVEASRPGDSEIVLRPASQTYFSASWLQHTRLEEIYGSLGLPEFLAVEPPNDSDEARRQFEYLTWLGVAPYPRVHQELAETRGKHIVNRMNTHPHRAEPLWDAWISSEPFQDALKCGQLHISSQQLEESYVLDRFEEVVGTRNRETLGALYRELAENWGSYYASRTEAVLHCQHHGHLGERRRKIPSLMTRSLQATAWVPVQARDRTLAAPSEVWRSAHQLPQHVTKELSLLAGELESVPGTHSLTEALSFVDAARPKAEDLISLLLRLKEQAANDPGEGSKGLYDAAHWAMRRLDEVLEYDNLGLEHFDIPLLARLGNQRIFVRDPFVADDSVVRRVWADSLPILDADRGLTRLASRVGLRHLEKELSITPVARRMMRADSLRLSSELDTAAPYLAAVAIDATPSKEVSIRSRLRHLQIEACQGLEIKYEFEGKLRIHGDARCYIAVKNPSPASRRLIGTAYLELSEPGASPDWYAFGPLLAEFLEVPQRDSFSLLLDATTEGRDGFARSRGLEEAVETQRVNLADPRQPAEFTGGFVAHPAAPDAEDQQSAGGENASSESEKRIESGQGGSSGRRSGASKRINRPAPPPPIDLSQIRVTEATGLSRTASPPAPSGSSSSGGGSGGAIDWEEAERIGREYGRRGEELVFELEQKRLRDRAMDAGAVVWVARDNETSSYDIESLDEDGHRIYIEVKSTSGTDETAPFLITAAELTFGLAKGPRYCIYRVLDVRSASPQVVIYRDPIEELRQGYAALRLSQAKLYLPRAGPEVSEQPSSEI